MANEATQEVVDVISKETLKKFNKSELATYARLNYDLRLDVANQSANEMIEQILNASYKHKGNAEMRVLKRGEVAGVPEGYVKIKLSAGEHNPKQRPVVVGLNFKMATIPVNQEVIMPGKWLVCLEDAVGSKPLISQGPDGKDVIEYVDQHRYPYTLLVDNR